MRSEQTAAEGGGETGSVLGQRVPIGIPPIPLNPDESHLIPLIPADATYPSESHLIPLIPADATYPSESHLIPVNPV